jgi:hypothetical protein
MSKTWIYPMSKISEKRVHFSETCFDANRRQLRAKCSDAGSEKLNPLQKKIPRFGQMIAPGLLCLRRDSLRFHDGIIRVFPLNERDGDQKLEQNRRGHEPDEARVAPH